MAYEVAKGRTGISVQAISKKTGIYIKLGLYSRINIVHPLYSCGECDNAAKPNKDLTFVLGNKSIEVLWKSYF
ncbi:hypothetical protein V1478_002332 [Vespula squamosa]|uniref:Uncharacterized protein n=1 Tax=Vespula squamosa TaxID=30214 RepID=A0ABD2BXH7_VESSQ